MFELVIEPFERFTNEFLIGHEEKDQRNQHKKTL